MFRSCGPVPPVPPPLKGAFCRSAPKSSRHRHRQLLRCVRRARSPRPPAHSGSHLRPSVRDVAMRQGSILRASPRGPRGTGDWQPGWPRICSHSSSLGLPGLLSTLAGTRSFPMSCKRADQCRRSRLVLLQIQLFGDEVGIHPYPFAVSARQPIVFGELFDQTEKVARQPQPVRVGPRRRSRARAFVRVGALFRCEVLQKTGRGRGRGKPSTSEQGRQWQQSTGLSRNDRIGDDR